MSSILQFVRGGVDLGRHSVVDLVQRQARHVDVAVSAQADGAVGAHEVLAGDGLETCRQLLGRLHQQDVRRLDDVGRQGLLGELVRRRRMRRQQDGRVAHVHDDGLRLQARRGNRGRLAGRGRAGDGNRLRDVDGGPHRRSRRRGVGHAGDPARRRHGFQNRHALDRLPDADRAEGRGGLRRGVGRTAARTAAGPATATVRPG